MAWYIRSWWTLGSFAVIQFSSPKAFWHTMFTAILQRLGCSSFATFTRDVHGKAWAILEWFTNAMPLFIHHQKVEALGVPTMPSRLLYWAVQLGVRHDQWGKGGVGGDLQRVLECSHQCAIVCWGQAAAECARFMELLNRWTVDEFSSDGKEESVVRCSLRGFGCIHWITIDFTTLVNWLRMKLLYSPYSELTDDICSPHVDLRPRLGKQVWPAENQASYLFRHGPGQECALLYKCSCFTKFGSILVLRRAGWQKTASRADGSSWFSSPSWILTLSRCWLLLQTVLALLHVLHT